MCIFQTFTDILVYVPVKMYRSVWCVCSFSDQSCAAHIIVQVAFLTQHPAWEAPGPPRSVPPAHPSAMLPIWRCRGSTFSPSRGAGVSGRAGSYKRTAGLKSPHTFRVHRYCSDSPPGHVPVHPPNITNTGICAQPFRFCRTGGIKAWCHGAAICLSLVTVESIIFSMALIFPCLIISFSFLSIFLSGICHFPTDMLSVT